MRRRLILFDSGGRKLEFELKAGRNLLGRSDPSESINPDIDLDGFDRDQKVSRKHAVIVCTDEATVIRDLGSINGTSLRAGELLSPNRDYPLEPNTEFILGNLLFSYVIGE